jgi:hypothetical protein
MLADMNVEMQEGKTTMAPASISFVRHMKFRVANTGTNRPGSITADVCAPRIVAFRATLASSPAR